MAREIVLDTETTGLDPQEGHRLIEVACVELEDYVPTGRHFHCYVNPEREIDADAERVHGISLSFLADKPTFDHPEVVDALLEFVGDAPLIAHNAGFDRKFVNYELARLGRAALHEKRWVDSLAIAQTRFPGAANSLDALCRRFKVSLAERDKHGALIDAQLLARVYLELRGGREVGLDLAQSVAVGVAQVAAQSAYGPRPRPLAARLTDFERDRHAAFVQAELKAGALWLTVE
ncbi:MAG TPA: DNA polymerase III subunit epsilon [Caulobacteraceae bacterium]|jgi:DNA polymerase-3 subunit epsilon|nr:DNA polymerase III subunit epsilon [Caulobacteraceae bacterium]